MGSAAAIVAIAGLAVSAGTTAYGISQTEKAKRKARQLEKSRPKATNPYASLRVSMLPSRLQQEQSLRSLATQTEAASRMGSRGGSVLPQLARQDALAGQQIASDVARREEALQQLQGRGEIYKTQQEWDAYNREMAGLSNLYSAGQSYTMGGLSNMMGTMASATSEGGAFNQGGSTGGLYSGRPFAWDSNTPRQLNPNNIGLQPSRATGFQTLTPNYQ